MESQGKFLDKVHVLGDRTFTVIHEKSKILLDRDSLRKMTKSKKIEGNWLA